MFVLVLKQTHHSEHSGAALVTFIHTDPFVGHGLAEAHFPTGQFLWKREYTWVMEHTSNKPQWGAVMWPNGLFSYYSTSQSVLFLLYHRTIITICHLLMHDTSRFSPFRVTFDVKPGEVSACLHCYSSYKQSVPHPALIFSPKIMQLTKTQKTYDVLSLEDIPALENLLIATKHPGLLP